MSYNRYRKRDKSEINRKDEVGLGRVDNYSSSDISESVMHSVRDYLYTPYFYEMVSDHRGSLNTFKFLESGHTMFIFSLYTMDYSGDKNVFDTISGSIVYEKPADPSNITKCPVGFEVLGNLENSKVLTESYLVVTCVKDSTTGKVVTYVGVDTYEKLPYTTYGVRYAGSNLHDYTLGAVDYTYEYQGDTYLKQWRYQIGSWVNTKKCTVAVPIYDLAADDYVLTNENMDVSSLRKDSATINGVPFCGAYKVSIDGQDARHITVPAKHKSSSLSDAGPHKWEVLEDYPVSGYSSEASVTETTDPKTSKTTTTRGTRYRTVNPLGSGDLDKNGLCTLSESDTSKNTVESFLESLGYYDESGNKNALKSESTVITVAILKRFYELLRLDIKDLKEELYKAIEKSIPTTTKVGTSVNLSVDVPTVSFASPLGAVTASLKPTGTVKTTWSDKTVTDSGNTTTIEYTWDYQGTYPITVKKGTTVIPSSGFTTVGTLNGTSATLTVILDSPSSTGSFKDLPLKLRTKYTDSTDGKEYYGQTQVLLSYTNNNQISRGALIDRNSSKTIITTAGASSGAPYYTIGSTVNTFNISHSEYSSLTNGQFVLYLNQVTKTNSVYTKDTPYNLSVKCQDSSAATITKVPYPGDTSKEIWKLTDTLPKPSAVTQTRKYTIEYSGGTFEVVNVNISSMNPSLYMTPGSEYWYGAVINPPTDQKTLTLLSNFEVTYTNSLDWLWITKVDNLKYTFYPSSNLTGEAREGSVTFYNTAGYSCTLKVHQEALEKYLYVSDLPGDPDKKISETGYYTGYSNTPNEENYTFKVYSNVEYEVYYIKDGETEGTRIKKSTATGKTAEPVTVTLAAAGTSSQRDDRERNTIKVVSDLGAIELTIWKPKVYESSGSTGSPYLTDPMIVNGPSDLVFHKEWAFDCARNEKIFVIQCEHPDTLSLSIEESGQNKLVAKIYYIDEEKGLAYVHAYPRTVDCWKTDSKSKLSFIYGSTGETEYREFTFEKTTTTVGRYFNISSTIVSFTKSTTVASTFKVTAWSPVSPDLLEMTYDSGAPENFFEISKDTTKGTASARYTEFTVTVPADKEPQSGSPWVFKVTYNGGASGSLPKYVCVYKSTDLRPAHSSSDTYYYTAFGQVAQMDGCEVTPIIYMTSRWESTLGTTTNPDVTTSQSFVHTQVVHDYEIKGLRLFEKTKTANFWTWNSSTYRMTYETCANCDTIEQSGTNMAVMLINDHQAKFSGTLDFATFNGAGSEEPDFTYTSAKATCATFSDPDTASKGNAHPVWPSTKATIFVGDIDGSLSDHHYLTDNTDLGFIPMPPDWGVTISEDVMSGYQVQDGYVNIASLPDTEISSNSYTLFRLKINGKTRFDNTETWTNTGPTGGQTKTFSKAEYRGHNCLKLDYPTNYEGEIDEEVVVPEHHYILFRLFASWLRPIFDGYFLKIQTSTLVNNNYCMVNGQSYKCPYTIENKGNYVLGVGNTLRLYTEFKANFSLYGAGFGGQTVAPGSYSSGALTDGVYIYNHRTKKVVNLPELDPDVVATFYDDGIYLNHGRVFCGQGRPETKVTTGLCGIAKVTSNTGASELVFLPYVQVSSETGGTKKYIVIDGFANNPEDTVSFGLGIPGFIDSKSTEVYVPITATIERKLVKSGYYTQSVTYNNITSVKDNDPGYLFNTHCHIPLFPKTHVRAKTCGSLKIAIHHLDFHRIIAHYFSLLKITKPSTDPGITVTTGDSFDWYFETSDDAAMDGGMGTDIPAYSKMTDIELSST